VDIQVSVTVKSKKVDTVIFSESVKEEKTKEKEETKDSHNTSMERILKQNLEQERTFITAVRGERKKRDNHQEKLEDEKVSKKRKRVTSEAKKIYKNK